MFLKKNLTLYICLESSEFIVILVKHTQTVFIRMNLWNWENRNPEGT